MSIKPILFNTEMVRAILDGRKNVTRRAIKPQPSGRPFPMPEESCWPGYFKFEGTNRVIKPPYQPGDTLWTRETWSTTDTCGLFPPWPSTGTHYIYKAELEVGHPYETEARWFPSIHMPRKAARIFLRVTDVRVERLQDIGRPGIFCEGIDRSMENEPVRRIFNAFHTLWDSTLKPADLSLYGWAANPWVWVIEFERCEMPEGWCK